MVIYVELSIPWFLWFVWIINSFSVFCSVSILVTWYSEACYLCIGLILEARKSMVYGLMSLCCWKWESKLVFNHPAVLAALKDCRFQIRWQRVFKNTPLKSQLFVDQIIVISLWTWREWNEKSYLHCYCPTRQSSKSWMKELEWLLSWSKSAAAWLGD